MVTMILFRLEPAAWRSTIPANTTLAVSCKPIISVMDAIFPTPHVVLGPFYPVQPPGDAGADLLRREPPAGSTLDLIEIAGRVLTATGRPIAGALVEIWHANALGQYL